MMIGCAVVCISTNASRVMVMITFISTCIHSVFILAHEQFRATMVGDWCKLLTGVLRPSRSFGCNVLKRFISIGILLQIIANCGRSGRSGINEPKAKPDQCELHFEMNGHFLYGCIGSGCRRGGNSEGGFMAMDVTVVRYLADRLV
uniref:Uncharacterized protein n=1 Tax=Anopheles coluzzii TaxID=1518534 RepID=A0A8W7PD54_ANOCL